MSLAMPVAALAIVFAEPAIEDAANPIPATAAPMAAPAPKEPTPMPPTLAPLMIPATIAGSLSVSMNNVRAETRRIPSSSMLLAADIVA